MGLFGRAPHGIDLSMARFGLCHGGFGQFRTDKQILQRLGLGHGKTFMEITHGIDGCGARWLCFTWCFAGGETVGGGFSMAAGFGRGAGLGQFGLAWRFGGGGGGFFRSQGGCFAPSDAGGGRPLLTVNEGGSGRGGFG